MTSERDQLAAAVKAVTEHTPQITRGAVNALKSSTPLSFRRHSLATAIDHTCALLLKLKATQKALQWDRGDRRDDVA